MVYKLSAARLGFLVCSCFYWNGAALGIVFMPRLFCILNRISFLIYNPNGSDEYTIGGNSIANCSFENTRQIVATGLTTNVPSIICDTIPKLETLVMEGLQIKTLQPSPFLNCGNLTTLKLGNNLITEIASYTFSNTNLQTLDLRNNSLEVLSSLSFYNLGELKTLNLAYNSKVNLPETVFERLSSLVTLELSHCGINLISVGWFKNLTSLNNLYLSYNAFSTIPSTTFDNVRNLIYLSMSYGALSLQSLHPLFIITQDYNLFT